MKLSTQSLVEHASGGDHPAIDELLARYLPELQAFVRLNMGPALAAKESSSDLVPVSYTHLTLPTSDLV